MTATITTPLADCNMCSEIVKLFQAPYPEDRYENPVDGNLNLGKISQLLAVDCPHATWLRDIQYTFGPVPFYENRDLFLGRYNRLSECVFFIDYFTKQMSIRTLTLNFKLVFRPELPKQCETVRILDRNWIDLDVVKYWPLTCTQLHGERCDKTVGAVPPFRPRLLIDVVRGCVAECHEEAPRYLTLSYTWGRSKNFRTTKSNVEEMRKPGVLESKAVASQLPRTILDAIRLTKALGERWLWVDSLCIVQDDEQSLQRELAAMHRIYATSFLTIVASDGEDAEYGLRGFRGISEPREINRIVLPLAGGERIVLLEPRRLHSVPAESELSYDQRMWTSQEFDFSKRRLIFCDNQVMWDCHCSRWEEDNTSMAPEWLPARNWGRGMKMKVPCLNLLSNMLWTFNSRTLRYDEDVCNAFAGYNTFLSDIFPSGLVYGHPQILFEISLCWSPVHTVRRRKVSERYTGDPVRTGLPSWSWMGWQGGIWFPEDLEAIEEGSYDMGFTESITEWYAMEYPGSRQKRRINSLWSQCRKSPPSSVAECWRREEIKPPAMLSLDKFIPQAHKPPPPRESNLVPLRMPKEMPSHRYTCLLDELPSPATRWYPIPVRKVGSEDESPSGVPSGYQYLWCRTFRASFNVALHDPSCKTRYQRLKNKNDDIVGALRLHNEQDIKLLELDSQVELIAVAKGWSAVLNQYSFEAPRSTTPPEDAQLTLEEEQRLGKEQEELQSKAVGDIPWMEEWEKKREEKQDCYHVLWIEWENGVAYRKGYGFVLEEEWDRVAETSTVDITLG